MPLFLAVIVGAFAAEPPRRVLLVHASGHASSPWSDFAGAFRSSLTKASSERVIFYEASLDTARVSDPSGEQPFVDYIHAILGGRGPDLIVPVGAPAAFFMQRYRSVLFPQSPMMIIGANQRRIPAASLTENDTGVLLNDDIGAFLRNILEILPATNQLSVVLGNSPVERYWAQELIREFQPALAGVKVETFNDLKFEEMLHRAATMGPGAAILWFLLSEDAAGVPYVQEQALEKMREVATVPIFGIGDYQLGRGIVGGPLIQTSVLGQRAAGVALRIFAGEKPSLIRAPHMTLSTPTYDWRELRRWNISESRLPTGSVIAFREQGVWQQYRWQIVSVMAVLLLQGAAISWLQIERHRRQRAEKNLRQRLSEVIHLNRTAMTGALSASVAHELGQPLGAIQSYAEAASLYLKADPPNLGRIEQILENIRRDDQRAADIISHLRGLLKKRDQEEWQEFDFNEAVRDALRVVRPEASKRGVELNTYQPDVSLSVRGNPVHVQQVILNLAMNGMDAMASIPGQRRMSIETALTGGDDIRVSVADSGTGIPSDKINEVFEPFYTTKGQGTGLGLSIARTIVETYGGKIWAENRSEGGAAFRFTMPLAKVAATAI